MSHSSVDDSHVKNPVSPVILPTSGGSEVEEEEQEDEWDDDDEDELEDSRDMKEDGLFGPRAPSAEQMRVHRLTHYPFRSWCPQCVAGRAKSWPHFRQEVDDDGGVPTICFDYCFLRDHPGGESVPVIVGREKKTKMMIAHVVPFKGGGVDWLVGHCFVT